MLKPVLGSQIQLGHPLANGLVGLWLMNEGSGNVTQDLSGNGIEGTLTAGLSWTSGKFGPAILFDGAGDNVSIPDPGWSTFSNGITIIARIKPDAAAADVDCIVSTLAVYSLSLRVRWDQSATQFLYGDGVDQDYESFAFLPAKSVWSTLAWSYDGNGNHVLYSDGILINSGLEDADPVSNQGNPILLGNDWEGKIGFIYIYDRALSASEIAQLYINPFGMFEEEI